MKVIVFGGSGYIGRNLISQLGAEEVAYYSRHRSEELEKNGVKWIEGNILDSGKVEEAVKGYDTIFNAVGVWDEAEQKHFDLSVKGVKNIVDAIRKYDKNQRLVYFSAINSHYGMAEYFSAKRVAEDNVATISNHLNVRMSIIYGRGDRLTRDLIRLSQENVPVPQGKNLAPVYIDDLITVLKNTWQVQGAITVSSKEKLSLSGMLNVIRKKKGLKPAKTVEGFFSKRAVSALESKGVFTRERIEMLLLDYERENTSLYRFVKEPMTYSKYIDELL